MIEELIPQYKLLEESFQNKVKKQFDELDLNLIKHVYQDVYLTGNEVDLTKIEEVPYVLKEDLNLDVVTEKQKQSMMVRLLLYYLLVAKEPV